MSTPQPLKYPYRWAAGIVNTFVEKYARGTWNVAKCVGMSPGEVRHSVVMSLAKGNSLQFEAIKRVIKVLEDYSKEDLSRYSAKERKQLYTWIVHLAENDTMDAKDAANTIDNWQNKRLIF